MSRVTPLPTFWRQTITHLFCDLNIGSGMALKDDMWCFIKGIAWGQRDVFQSSARGLGP